MRNGGKEKIMSRLNIDRQNKLEPERMQHAIHSLGKIGMIIQLATTKEIQLVYKNELIKFFPYSGWHTGKSIKDGRGLNNLLKQLIP